MTTATETDHAWGDAPELYGPRHDYRESLVLRRLLRALPGPRVLNAGAGAGSLTFKMIDAGFQVTSVDASAPFCDWVRAGLQERGVAEGNPVICSELGSGTLTLEPGSFDAVVCAEVLEHLDDDAAALAELAAALKPGGLLLVTVPANPYRYDWTDRWAGHRRRYTVEQLRLRIERAGFRDVEVKGWGFPFTGFYHRHVYRPMLRRRMRIREGRGGADLGGAPPRLASRVIRAVLEIDTLFLGRRPGYHGLIAVARRGDRPG
jgi:SAM-dependent methyltransferase